MQNICLFVHFWRKPKQQKHSFEKYNGIEEKKNWAREFSKGLIDNLLPWKTHAWNFTTEKIVANVFILGWNLQTSSWWPSTQWLSKTNMLPLFRMRNTVYMLRYDFTKIIHAEKNTRSIVVTWLININHMLSRYNYFLSTYQSKHSSRKYFRISAKME